MTQCNQVAVAKPRRSPNPYPTCHESALAHCAQNKPFCTQLTFAGAFTRTVGDPHVLSPARSAGPITASRPLDFRRVVRQLHLRAVVSRRPEPRSLSSCRHPSSEETLRIDGARVNHYSRNGWIEA